jgi:hypothetical protein
MILGVISSVNPEFKQSMHLRVLRYSFIHRHPITMKGEEEGKRNGAYRIWECMMRKTVESIGAWNVCMKFGVDFARTVTEYILDMLDLMTMMMMVTMVGAKQAKISLGGG